VAKRGVGTEHETADAAAEPIAFPDPFPPLPHEPYRAEDSEGPDPATDPQLPAAALADHEPPTDPSMPAVTAYYNDFDPFAADAYRPEVPWHRRRAAILALAAIGLALVAILVAAVLLVAGQWGTSDEPENVSPAPSTSSSPQAPTTTPLTSAPPPPPPPPPPPSSAPPGAPRNTYYPQYPRQTRDAPAPRPQTRPPDISVRPTHRTAFPNQPGAN
jgi:hypothetical protein